MKSIKISNPQAVALANMLKKFTPAVDDARERGLIIEFEERLKVMLPKKEGSTNEPA